MSQFNFNDVIEWGALNETEREEILRRPAVMAGDLKMRPMVTIILVRTSGSRPRRSTPPSHVCPRTSWPL